MAVSCSQPTCTGLNPMWTFFFSPPPNISVACHPDFPVDYNLMGCNRGEVALHFEHKTFTGTGGPSSINISPLNDVKSPLY